MQLFPNWPSATLSHLWSTNVWVERQRSVGGTSPSLLPPRSAISILNEEDAFLRPAHSWAPFGCSNSSKNIPFELFCGDFQLSWKIAESPCHLPVAFPIPLVAAPIPLGGYPYSPRGTRRQGAQPVRSPHIPLGHPGVPLGSTGSFQRTDYPSKAP